MARGRDLRREKSDKLSDAGVMSSGDLAEMRRSLSHLNIDAVRHAYHTAYARCRMVNDRVPSARSIQELVQVWKQLWKWR